MKKLNLIKTVFSFWVLLVILSVSWFAHIFYDNLRLISQSYIVLFALIVASISLVLSLSFISFMIVDFLKEIKIEKERQKDINDVYKYNQVVEPPSIYN